MISMSERDEVSCLRSLTPVVVATSVLLSCSRPGLGSTSDTVVKMLGRDQGVCVIIGCGNEKTPGLAAKLAASGNMLVHGIALGRASLGRAQRDVSAAGVDGLAAIEQVPVNPLPYRDNLANAVVVPDLAAASAAGVSQEELLRVTAPFGKLCVSKARKWDVTTKPMPKEMDEWTHEAHGPDGNCVSSDTVLHFPVGFRWHAGLPMNLCNRKRPANAWSSTRGVALVGGRCFTLSASVLENLGPAYFSEHGMDQYVTARDAFNGLFLWRTNVGSTYYGGLIYPNRAPFAAVGDFVYAASGEGKLIALDVATGKLAKTFDTTYPPGRLLIDQGVAVVAGWKDGTKVGGTHGVDRRRMDFSVGEGAVEGFDALSANRLWKIDKLATSIRSSGGVLFMIQREGVDKREEVGRRRGKEETPLPARPKQTLVAVDLRTGKQLWATAPEVFGPDEYLRMDAAGLGVATVSRDNGTKTSVFSAKDGKLLLEVKSGSYTAFHDGVMHLGSRKYDPATGKMLGGSKIRLGRTTCTPYYFVNGITVANRGGALIVDGKRVMYGGARGGCLFASIPAYGLFHTPPNWCACAPAQIPGFIAFGPIPQEPTPAGMEAPPVVEKGPASETIANRQSTIANPQDWPMYRHDRWRSSATRAPAPQQLDVLWQKTVAAPTPDGPIGLDWKEYLNSPVTAPVAAEGLVVVAATDRNQVVAFDARSGKQRWCYSVGGRVDTPPTIHAGRCLFGSHDGYVYALSSKDGQLVWRMRAAPREERMVSYAKIESPWPVIGSVLISDGLGYASAGRTQGSDGGIVVRAFEPSTGRIVWSKAITPSQEGASYRDLRRNDLMLKVGSVIQLMVTRMDPQTGEPKKNLTRDYEKYLRRKVIAKARKKPFEEDPMTLEEIAPSIGLEGFTSWNWTRLGTRKHKSMGIGNMAGSLTCWDDRIVCAVTSDGRTVNAYGREHLKPYGNKPAPAALKWTVKLPPTHQATSAIVCGNAVVIGGGIYEKEAAKGAGFVRVLPLEKGEQIADRTFDAPLSYNSIAAAGGLIYATFTDGTAACLGGKLE